MQLKGYVAGWTDGSEVNVISIWETEDEAKDACQQDQRDGDDMSMPPGMHSVAYAENEGLSLDWQSDGDDKEYAPCDNGQGDYLVFRA